MILDDALAGVRVVALEQAVAMPFCTQILASLGADVIKVEPPRGDVIRGWDSAVRGLSTGFVAFNAGKRDIVIDAKLDAGRDVLRKLALSADVLVENLTPGTAARLGASPTELLAEKPQLIYCSLSGYGQDGPYRDVKAYDLLVQGESGLLLTNGSPNEPAKVGIPIVDMIAGVHAALGIIAALRKETGGLLDVSMLESAAYWLSYYPHHWWHQHAEPPRSGMRHQYLSPYGPFQAADGTYVNVVVASDSDWQRFCVAIGREDLLEDGRFASMAKRSRNRTELERTIEATLATEPAETWLERLAAADLPHGRVRSIEEVLEHPQLLARRAFGQADSPVGPLPLIHFPLTGDRDQPIPGLGQHTRDVLCELGYADAEIEHLQAFGAIR
jgi:crotonobetainyl-CoA:carnitine CoA-transferase CaiB-like acyl-CoA transferase